MIAYQVERKIALSRLQAELMELLDLVRDEVTYRAALIARPDIKPGLAAEEEFDRKVQRIRELRERWDLL